MRSDKKIFFRPSPYALCWSSMPFILLIGLFLGQHTLDLQLYDTYYVVAISQYIIAVAILTWFFGALYWTMIKLGKKPNYMLSVLHIATTVLILSVIAFRSSWIVGSFETAFAVLSIFVISQIAFLANVLLSFLRK